MVAVGETIIEGPALPLSQAYDTPPEAFNVTWSPLQIMPSLGALPDPSAADTEGVGGVQTPGTVATGVDSELDNVLSKSQLHLVLTDMALVWS